MNTMLEIVYDKTIDYYDGEQIWRGHNKDHTIVGVCLNDEGDYLLSFTTDEKSNDFESGNIGLRELMLSNSIGKWLVYRFLSPRYTVLEFVKELNNDEFDELFSAQHDYRITNYNQL